MMRKVERHQFIFWISFILTIAFVVNVSGDEEANDSDDEMSRSFRWHRPHEDRPCQHRRQEGVCKKKSECKRPTRHTCRFGVNPIVCCLDRDDTTVLTTKPTRPPTRKPPPIKPADVKKIDLTFPNCGRRSPQLPGRSRGNEVSPTPTRRIGGLLSRLGKRSAIFGRILKRQRRFGLGQMHRPIIVGGREAKSNSWPWMVALFKETGPGIAKRFLCGASLISQRYVVTAAHCFDAEKNGPNPSKFSVILGSHSSRDGTEYPVESILLHPGYQKRQYYNDLCLLKIRGQVTLNNTTYPVCLPSDGLRDKIRSGESDVTVTGWGDTNFGGVSSKVLQEVTVPIVPLKECNASYANVARANFPRGITNVFICAGLREGGKDACQGDSGGPMVTKLKDDSWVQLGVVSFGYGCAQAGFPGVYTRLSEYTEWFYDNTDLGRENLF